MMRRYFWMPVCTVVALSGASVAAAAGEPRPLTPVELDTVTAGAISVLSQSDAAAAGRPGVAFSLNRAEIATRGGSTLGLGYAVGFADGDEERSSSANTDIASDREFLQIPVDFGNDAGNTSLSVAVDAGVFLPSLAER